MGAAQSPLFEPVLWHGAGFRILDEIQVPEKIEYLAVSEVQEALGAVRAMKTRAFGQVLTFLYSGALLAQQHGNKDVASLRLRIAEMTEQFCAARPTFDFRGLGSSFDAWLNELPPGSDPGATIARQAKEFGKRIVRGRLTRANFAASVLPNRVRVLTHCNVSGELVALAHRCEELGKQISVLATETRPYLQGARLTAWELAQAGVSVSVIPDNAVAQVMEQGAVDAVIVGADRAAQNGDIINKVGTYPLALMAKDFGVPFYALVQDPRSLERGADVAIEERPAAELLEFQGELLVGSGNDSLQVRYPAFDMTPAALITRLIGFDEIYTPESFRQRYQKQTSNRQSRPARSGKYLLVYGVPPKSQYAFLASALKAEGAESILVPEMRPELWGSALVVPELLEQRVPATLISDNMMGTLFAQGEIRKLCLFYDTLTGEGPRAICGSQLAARLARSHGVDVELFSGAGERKPTRDRDVGTFLGRKTCPAAASVRAVGAEVVPWALLRN
jgi:methylthioribose-1-phosphate isomerase